MKTYEIIREFECDGNEMVVVMVRNNDGIYKVASVMLKSEFNTIMKKERKYYQEIKHKNKVA